MVDEVGFTHGPRSRITEESRQAVLDAELLAPVDQREAGVRAAEIGHQA